MTDTRDIARELVETLVGQSMETVLRALNRNAPFADLGDGRPTAPWFVDLYNRLRAELHRGAPRINHAAGRHQCDCERCGAPENPFAGAQQP